MRLFLIHVNMSVCKSSLQNVAILKLIHC